MTPTSTKLKCAKCSKEIKTRKFLKCSHCAKYYDVECTANVTLNRFFLMTHENRTIWKCYTCACPTTGNLQLPAKHNKPSTSRISLDNVTRRKHKPVLQKSLSLSPVNTPDEMEDQPFCSSPEQETLTDKEISIQSLPNFTENSQILELKDEITVLTTQLNSAHEEIEVLNSEITRLTKGHADLERQIVILKKLFDDGIPRTPGQITPKTGKKMRINKESLGFLPSPRISNAENLSKTVEVPAPVPTYLPNLTTNFKIPLELDDSARTLHCHATVNTANTRVSVVKKTPVSTYVKHKIFVFGGEQCTGIASMLLRLRHGNDFKKYDVRSFIKPGADTEAILDSTRFHDFSKGDKIVLSLGEHDSNPIKILTCLNKVLNGIEGCNVFILAIRESKDIDVNMLNYMLRQSCVNINNLTYVENSKPRTRNSNKFMYLKNSCKKLNTIIDQLDYKETYYNFKNEDVIHQNPKNNINSRNSVHFKGTIPYYFFRKRE